MCVVVCNGVSNGDSSHTTMCGMGGKFDGKIHTIWVFTNLHFRAWYSTFWPRRPPGHVCQHDQINHHDDDHD